MELWVLNKQKYAREGACNRDCLALVDEHPRIDLPIYPHRVIFKFFVDYLLIDLFNSLLSLCSKRK